MTESNSDINNKSTKRIVDIVALILQDGGKTDIFKLAEQIGFTEDESRKQFPFLFLSAAKMMKTKSAELSKEKITRKDQKEALETIYSRLLKKIAKDTNGDFELNDTTRKDVALLLSLDAQLSKFEGRNKPDKVEIEVNQRVDLSKVSIEDQEKMLNIYERAKIEEQE